MCVRVLASIVQRGKNVSFTAYCCGLTFQRTFNIHILHINCSDGILSLTFFSVSLTLRLHLCAAK